MTITDHAAPLTSREGLLLELDAIDTEGWESDRGRSLLSYVRTAVVHPQVLSARLRGPGADQAEATGWEVAWEALASPRIREVQSPWGWIWVAVQRAISSEVMGARYLTTEDKGRRAFAAQASTDSATHLAPPLSLTQLVDRGWEREQRATHLQLGPSLQAVVVALVAAGWEPRAAHAVLEGVISSVTRDGGGRNVAQGWRTLAARLGLPPWQVRRVSLALLGAPGWAGAIERIRDRGLVALEDSDLRAALRSTALSSLPTPVAAARMSRPQEPGRVA